MKKIISLLFVLFISKHASAFQFDYVDDVVITQPVHENLYISGGHVIINAPVYADLVIAGGVIEINDSVMKDILITGGSVTFNGYTKGSIRCLGARLHILKNIGGDLIVIGGNIVVEKETTIMGIVSINCSTLSFDGTAENDFSAKGSTIYFNGAAEKEIHITSQKINFNGEVSGNAVLAANEISLDSNSLFGSDVHFWNDKGSLDFGNSIKKGKANYDDSLALPYAHWYFLGRFSLITFFIYLGTIFLMIAIIQYLFGTVMKNAASKVLDAPLISFGTGILFFVLIPIIAVISFITVVGIPISIILLFCYFCVLLSTSIIASVVAANWFNNRSANKMRNWQIICVSFLIFLILKSLSSIDFFGWIIYLFAGSMSIGAIVRNIKWKKSIKAKQPL